MVECGVFGPGVAESVLNGSHSVRAHWHVNCGRSYSITPVEDVLASETKQIILCCSIHQHIIDFEKECEAKSELCKFSEFG